MVSDGLRCFQVLVVRFRVFQANKYLLGDD